MIDNGILKSLPVIIGNTTAAIFYQDNQSENMITLKKY